jgi:hypothetical protein
MVVLTRNRILDSIIVADEIVSRIGWKCRWGDDDGLGWNSQRCEWNHIGRSRSSEDLAEGSGKKKGSDFRGWIGSLTPSPDQRQLIRNKQRQGTRRGTGRRGDGARSGRLSEERTQSRLGQHISVGREDKIQIVAFKIRKEEKVAGVDNDFYMIRAETSGVLEGGLETCLSAEGDGRSRRDLEGLEEKLVHNEGKARLITLARGEDLFDLVLDDSMKIRMRKALVWSKKSSK